MNHNEIELKHVINLELLQKFQDNFAECMDIASVTVDMNGVPITKPSSYTSFCMEHTQGSKIGYDRCAASHKAGGEQATKMGRPYVYQCHAGLIDFAAPILVDGKQIATILGGQILTSKPDEDSFKRTAREIGIKEETYYEAVKKVKLTEEKNIEAAAEVLYIVANALSQIGYQKYKLKEMSSTLVEDFTQISATMEELAASSVSINENQETLNQEINNVKNISEQINEILNAIKNIADETKMLGLNAAIEAARAGEAGRGFTVVASEIRSLSQNSKETAMQIVKLTSEIQASVQKTLQISDSTMENTEQQSAAIQQTTASVEEIVALTHELDSMARQE